MKEDYNISKEFQPKFPVRRTLDVPHQGKRLFVSYPAFGPKTFDNNVKEMNKDYIHSETGERMTFREPTTAESISVANKAYSLIKKEILKPSYLQLGRHLRTSEGVFVNPPKDRDGKPIVDEKVLKQYLNEAKKINGIWRVSNNEIKGVRDFAFAPYETFKQGEQSLEDFTVNPKANGLARALEFSHNKKAPKLEKISADYSNIYTWNFDSVAEPKLGASVLSGRNDGGLDVLGISWEDDDQAFGVKV
ncbi:MAG: hypothetical protein PF542_04260 [Nanoarchaeota archaeon]|jgi:hypothetical protein|nr:hypothetical protein [Nanoarchaeota archaeon]